MIDSKRKRESVKLKLINVIINAFRLIIKLRNQNNFITLETNL